jgi:hypothetical protein
MTPYRALIASIILVAGTGAFAAAGTGDNVVTIDVTKVLLPAKMPGLCNVSGTIAEVWTGKAFHAGQPLALKVPCSNGASVLTPANAVAEDSHYSVISADVLLKSKKGVARLDDSGALIWKVTGQSFGTMGAVWGYRVLDGAALPAAPLKKAS